MDPQENTPHKPHALLEASPSPSTSAMRLTLRSQNGGRLSGRSPVARRMTTGLSRGLLGRSSSTGRRSISPAASEIASSPYLCELPFVDPEPDPSTAGRRGVETIKSDKRRQLRVLQTVHPLGRSMDRRNVSLHGLTAGGYGAEVIGFFCKPPLTTSYKSLAHRSPDVNLALEMAGKW